MVDPVGEPELLAGAVALKDDRVRRGRGRQDPLSAGPDRIAAVRKPLCAGVDSNAGHGKQADDSPVRRFSAKIAAAFR